MRYYSTQRPIMPGSYPKPQGNAVIAVHNFDIRTYCEEIDREAWGYIDYEQPLAPEDARRYELIADGVGCNGCVHERVDRTMDCCWDCNRNPRRARHDLYQHRAGGGGQP